MKRLGSLLAVGALGLLAPAAAHAQDPAPRATFALIIGANQSVDANLTPLRYADDDAARYLDLFRLLGARTYLLSRLDDNTKRLHPQAAAEASDPKKLQYEAAIAQLKADVTQASERGVETTVYFVYAGHGNVDKGQGYITLEDMRLTGNDLAATFKQVPATRIHVIADACASYFLAYSRGPGGERRSIDGFNIASALTQDSRVGLLLSTSSARESHEWDAFQSGVFSHEVRSGLYGAADADGDGQVSYHEIAAFVARANSAIPNERYRPDLHARAPRGGDLLLDLRRANGRRIEIDGKHAGHYYLEDARGVRIADVHNSANQSVSLIRPAPTGRAYLRHVDDDRELVIEPHPDVVAIADLNEEDPRVASRGAASESFNALFALPFDRAYVAIYPPVDCGPVNPGPAPDMIVDHRSDRAAWRTPVAIGAFTLAATAITFGAIESSRVAHIRANENDVTGQTFAVRDNRLMRQEEAAATGLYVTAGVFTAAGLGILLWPSSKTRLRVGFAPKAAVIGGAF